MRSFAISLCALACGAPPMATGVDTKAEGVSSRLRNLRIGAHLWNADAAQKYLGRSVDQAMITMSWAKDGEDFSNLS